MKWHNRERKLKNRKTQKDMSRPFRREKEKDSDYKKRLAQYRKKVKQDEKKAEVQEEVEEDVWFH